MQTGNESNGTTGNLDYCGLGKAAKLYQQIQNLTFLVQQEGIL
jgi:hypothetical protein